MPANRKAGREEIIKAALAVLRRDGFEAVNARSVAKELGCSTQPIYHSFRNMEDLKAELTAKAAEAHAERVRAFLSRNDGSHSHYCDSGLGFVRFAEQEKQTSDVEEPGFYMVQTGIYRVRTNAEREVERLKAQGFPAFMTFKDGFYYVRAGAFRNMENAVRQEQELRKLGYPTLLVKT